MYGISLLTVTRLSFPRLDCIWFCDSAITYGYRVCSFPFLKDMLIPIVDCHIYLNNSSLSIDVTFMKRFIGWQSLPGSIFYDVVFHYMNIWLRSDGLFTVRFALPETASVLYLFLNLIVG